MFYERSAYFLRYFSGSSLVRLGDLNLLEIWYQKIEDKVALQHQQCKEGVNKSYIILTSLIVAWDDE